MSFADLGRRLWHGLQQIEASPEWIAAAGPDFADTIMTVPVTDRFHAKQGRSIGRWMLPRSGQPSLVVYLKRHHRLSWWRRAMALVRPSDLPSIQEWRHLAWAKTVGIPVPDALAVGTFLGPGLQARCFLAVRELTGMLALHEWIPLAAETMPSEVFSTTKRALTAEMARLAHLLHDQQRFHKDLYLCHYYLPTVLLDEWREPVRGQLYLIDFHRLGHHCWFSGRWQVKDFAQLLYSTRNVIGVNDRDRLRFLRAYLGGRKLDAGGRSLLRAVQRKVAWYLRHDRRRSPRARQETFPTRARVVQETAAAL